MEETRRLLRAAERGALPGTTGGVRDRAIVTVLLFTALHIAELAALNTSDVVISARKGLAPRAAAKATATGKFRSTPRPATRLMRGWPPASTFPAATDRRCSCP